MAERFESVGEVVDRLRAAEDRLFSQFDLTPQQYNALRLLRGEHPAALATLDLARRLVSHAPDITRLLDKLEARALIRRARPAENRRLVEVTITVAGLALLETLGEPVRACHAAQLGHLPAGALKDLVKLLHEARRPHEDLASPWS